MNTFRKTLIWMRKYYFNFKIKDSYESYQYAKYMRKVI